MIVIVKPLNRVEGIDTFTAALYDELGGPGRAQQGTRGGADPGPLGRWAAIGPSPPNREEVRRNARSLYIK